MELVAGPNPPRRCSDTTMGMGGNTWHVLLESPSCLLSQTEWGGTLRGQHPPWQLPEERPLWKWDSNPTCMSQWERGALCHCCLRMGQEAVTTPGQPAELLTTANAQTLQLTACLCSAGHYLVGEPELQTSDFYLPAISSAWGGGSRAAPCCRPACCIAPAFGTMGSSVPCPGMLTAQNVLHSASPSPP